MTIDYKKSFEKLVEQIRLERQWTENHLNSDEELDLGERKFYIGLRSAYDSIDSLAEQLEKGEFEFGD